LSSLQAAFSAVHWLGVAVYTGSLIFLFLIFQKTYDRYRSYKYVDNFRAEILQLYWRLLHVAFLLILVSGAVLAGMKGRSVLSGLYGLVFSAKLALWLLQIYLSQYMLKPFHIETSNDADSRRVKEVQAHPYLIVALLLLIPLCGFVLKYL